MRSIELLSPAANLDVAVAAVNAGADAVYMGGPAFGARSKAVNSIADVEKAATYAHRFGARLFLTLNTLVFEDEIPRALQIARQAVDAGVDGLLIQDLGLLQAGLCQLPVELHASTQCHIDSMEKALFLEQLGFKRLVLARELSLREIAAVRRALRPDTEIETFIHGALCVSYSGQCYMSCYLNGRSGNRGDCAQPCRMAWSLFNDKGKELVHDRYLLSMKDLNAGAYLEQLADAGVDCFKIEGRMKDALYVKNVTLHYRRALDAVLSARNIAPASHGYISAAFSANVEKSFHRPYCGFNLSGKRSPLAVLETPKATGQKAGSIEEIVKFKPNEFSGLCIKVKPADGAVFSSADGLCYIDRDGNLQGNQVEKAEQKAGAWNLYMAAPEKENRLPRPGSPLYRNKDRVFEKALQTAKIERHIPVKIEFNADSYTFAAYDAYGNRVEMQADKEIFQEAKNAEAAKKNFAVQLGKLGGTGYVLEDFIYKGESVFFASASELNAVRRNLAEKLNHCREERYRPRKPEGKPLTPEAFPVRVPEKLSYRSNCANSYTEELYRRSGAVSVEPAFELQKEQHRNRDGETLMECKHCIRFQLGQCLKQGVTNPEYKGDLFLKASKHKFALKFNCDICRMQVVSCKEGI